MWEGETLETENPQSINRLISADTEDTDETGTWNNAASRLVHRITINQIGFNRAAIMRQLKRCYCPPRMGSQQFISTRHFTRMSGVVPRTGGRQTEPRTARSPSLVAGLSRAISCTCIELKLVTMLRPPVPFFG